MQVKWGGESKCGSDFDFVLLLEKIVDIFVFLDLDVIVVMYFTYALTLSLEIIQLLDLLWYYIDNVHVCNNKTFGELAETTTTEAC